MSKSGPLKIYLHEKTNIEKVEKREEKEKRREERRERKKSILFYDDGAVDSVASFSNELRIMDSLQPTLQPLLLLPSYF